ncbi:PaaI family thioesterase [Gordonia sp. HY442]|uniref:PaaI family thioesterase n=1 Tax=Gordonia zhenghanii TaxID=2911516 RepID=UPI001F43E6E0|nr:PaaI family thioesterase [Gordonia zhenghanii]MCF8606942.1 PaaI family thioesterase [Gordonia zhenghanii]
MTPTTPPNGSETMRLFFPTSPFVSTLGVEIIDLGEGTARLRMPFRDTNTTVGPMVHGGAIGACVDLGVMAAAWSGTAPAPEQPRGVTVSMSVNFVAPAIDDDVDIVATRLRKGRRLSHCAVEIRTRSDDRLVATGSGVYQIG